MGKLIFLGLAALAGIVFVLDYTLTPSLRGQEPQDTVIATPFGPIATESRDVDLRNRLRAGPQSAAYVRASIELVWPGDAFGDSHSARKQNLAARAPELAQKECEALLRNVASSCQVVSTTADSWSDSVILRASLNLVAKEAFEVSPAEAPRSVEAIHLGYDNDASTPEAAAAARNRIYAQMRRDCREMRQVYGNCMLYRIHVNSVLMGKAGRFRIDTAARASMAVIRQRILSN